MFSLSIFQNTIAIVVIGASLFLVLAVAMVLTWYKKVPQGKAIVRTGYGGITVKFNAAVVVPVLHRMEWMDISIKKVEISRTGKDGLICKDNMRADIKVVFFVRVNPLPDDVGKVAQTIGVERASHEDTLNSLFEAKFSEALKTVGKRFDFVDLYDAREKFRQEILNAIGQNLNGYHLDDAAIDYLEQTPIQFLQDTNILDSEGIKKIAELTAQQHIEANKIRRQEEMTVTQQNVESQEAILQLNRQLAEKQQIQFREIAAITAREEAETKKIQQEERLRSETARITTEEELAIAEQNKQRQIIVAEKSKEKTAAVETERVTKEKELEINERQRVVSLAQIEKEKAVEVEKKNIQEVIRERVVVEKATVAEEEKIKDTREFALANREKQVAITNAEKQSEQAKITLVVTAQAEKDAATVNAEKKLIEADAMLKASILDADSMKKLAEAKAAQEAAPGIAEAQVMEAKAGALERQGSAEAKVIEMKAGAEAKEMELKAAARGKEIEFKATAEAMEIEIKAQADSKGIEMKAGAEAKEIELKAIANEIEGLKQANVLEQTALANAKGKTANADATEKQGLAEAHVIEEKLLAEAKGIEGKAEAMKKLDGVGKEHEEFKLRLAKEKDVELAQINIQASIAQAQASVLAEALKSAKIEIVGGEQQFFDQIIRSITQARSIDRLVEGSNVLSEVKENLLDGEGGNIIEKIKGVIAQLGLSSDDIKNLSIANLLLQMSGNTDDKGLKGTLAKLLDAAKQAGIANKSAGILGL
ncbi:MAG TPA: flotillin family protein [Bacteroidia bacterium]|nr:flotillin family protein [Bacteroidia bacterium]